MESGLRYPGRWQRSLGRALIVMGVALFLLALLLFPAIGSLGLRPGWEWIRVFRVQALLAPFPLVFAGLLFVAIGWRRGVPTSSRWRLLLDASVVLFLVGTVALVPLFVCGGMLYKAPRIHHLDAPGGQVAVLQLREGLSNRGVLWIGPPPLRESEPLADFHLWCDGRMSLRRSSRPGRYLVIDSLAVAGAVIDLNVPSVADDRETMPPLEELRAEFGDDVWFNYPGCGDRPEEPGG